MSARRCAAVELRGKGVLGRAARPSICCVGDGWWVCVCGGGGGVDCVCGLVVCMPVASGGRVRDLEVT
jgi:hypothetical protein